MLSETGGVAGMPPGQTGGRQGTQELNLPALVLLSLGKKDGARFKFARQEICLSALYEYPY